MMGIQKWPYKPGSKKATNVCGLFFCEQNLSWRLFGKGSPSLPDWRGGALAGNRFSQPTRRLLAPTARELTNLENLHDFVPVIIDYLDRNLACFRFLERHRD
jgi:hypothetical protein